MSMTDTTQANKRELSPLKHLKNASLEQWQAYFLQQAQTPHKSQMPEHKTNYRQGLLSWMGIIYLQTQAFMGHQFEAVVHRYIDQTPLTTANIDQFERDFLWTLKQKAPEYYDVGLVDWSIHQSYLAQNAQAFAFDQFARLSQDQQLALRFQAAPSIFVVQSPLRLDALWQAYSQGELVIAAQLLKQASAEVSRYLIYRQEYRPEVKLLCEAQVALYQSLQAQEPLAAFSELALEALPVWIESGFITRFY